MLNSPWPSAVEVYGYARRVNGEARHHLQKLRYTNRREPQDSFSDADGHVGKDYKDETLAWSQKYYDARLHLLPQSRFDV